MREWKTWIYVFLIIGGISLIIAIIAGLAKSTVIGITPRGYLEFTQTCFLLAANFGILQILSKKEK